MHKVGDKVRVKDADKNHRLLCDLVAPLTVIAVCGDIATVRDSRGKEQGGMLADRYVPYEPTKPATYIVISESEFDEFIQFRTRAEADAAAKQDDQDDGERYYVAEVVAKTAPGAVQVVKF